MNMTSRQGIVNVVLITIGVTARWAAAAEHDGARDGQVVKAIVDARAAGGNRLKDDAWRPWQLGFKRQAGQWVCDNGDNKGAQRGASQTVRLEQTRPEPIVATAWSKGQAVTGTPDNNYALYLDLTFDDGATLWGQAARFDTGTHDWQRRKVVILPEKPVKEVTVNMLFRSHGGKAVFRDPQLRVARAPRGAVLFDGVPVAVEGQPPEGFQVRDVAAGSDFVTIRRKALGLTLDCQQTRRGGATLLDVTLSDTTGKDRAVTLVYAIAVAPDKLRWLQGPRRSMIVQAGREYIHAGRFHVGANGRLSRYPLAAVANAARGVALGIDMARPAFFRAAYHAGTRELYLAYDLGLTPERPAAHVRLCRYPFHAGEGFRGALARYYDIFPDAFQCRTPEQGLWMPFAKISQVEGWKDFGFRFKEGANETAWDDQHGILTFRYTEPMTWWMRMPPEMPRTLEAALAEAQRRATQKNDRQAKALLTSGYHNASGQYAARLLNTPWCNGAVWSVNSMPGIRGEITDFRNKWNARLRRRLYGSDVPAALDGEYIDSSEGYVTDELDFRRDHFAAAATPLVFSMEEHRPAIFRGLIAFEYIRGIAEDIHAMDKLMMANGTPGQFCWFAPLLDVMGTETDWHRGKWSPMSDAELLYRRALCRSKPYCFLMNTRFEDFSHQLVERYMKRCLAYGMFPGFFSHNAAQGHYFTRPKLYNRDRDLFVKYVPLCQRVAQAGWRPLTGARTDDDRAYVERFGDRYLTVLNDRPERRTITVSFDGDAPASSRELVHGLPLHWQSGRVTLTLEGEDVAVLDMAP